MMQGIYAEAISSFDRLVKINPNNYDAWFNRGFILGKLGRYKEAINSYHKAIEIKSKYLQKISI